MEIKDCTKNNLSYYDKKIIWMRICVSILVELNGDLAGDGVANGLEGLLGEVEGSIASRAVVDDRDGDGDGAVGAGVGHGIRAPGAVHGVRPPAHLAAVPQLAADCRDHFALVLGPVARRRCIHEQRHRQKRSAKNYFCEHTKDLRVDILGEESDQPIQRENVKTK